MRISPSLPLRFKAPSLVFYVGHTDQKPSRLSRPFMEYTRSGGTARLARVSLASPQKIVDLATTRGVRSSMPNHSSTLLPDD